MPLLLWVRDITSDADGIKHTFSSWDSCMSKTYCKWPVIAAIIVASLIALSLIFCLLRCLCCGAECCCGCLACCNACCPSPRRRGRKGYDQPPPMPAAGYGGAGYYQSPPPPMYAPGPAQGAYYGGYRGAQTATFDAPTNPTSNMGPMGGVYDQRPVNDDALPHMPSWDQARSRHVEDDVEMEKLTQPPHVEQQQSLLPQNNNDRYYSHQDSGDIGSMSASPYEDTAYRAQHNYSAYSQQVPMSPYETRSPAPLNTSFTGAHAPAASSYYGSPTSTVPPSYQTHPPSMVGSPPPGVQRKPIQGSWRDV